VQSVAVWVRRFSPGRGISSHLAGRLDEASASLRATLALSPGRIGGHYGIGVALLLKGEPEAALAAMQQESFHEHRLIGSRWLDTRRPVPGLVNS